MVDDEFQGRTFPDKVIIKLFPELTIIGHAATIQEAVNIISKQEPQLVFLDVMLNKEIIHLFKKKMNSKFLYSFYNRPINNIRRITLKSGRIINFNFTCLFILLFCIIKQKNENITQNRYGCTSAVISSILHKRQH